MDFFQQQDRARKKTKLLVFYFAIAVAALIVAVYFASLVIFSGVQSQQHHNFGEQPQFELWNPQLFLCVAGGVLAVVLIGSGYKTMALAQGGSVVSEMMGGRLVKPNSNDPDERKLLNVVEEMAIASGVPAPQVYVMDEEDGINAFAAGHKPGDATVTVTRGCMKLLSRDELQGVIGHEFSHILNGDMRMNLRLMGIIFGILCLAIIGRILLQTARGGGRSRGQNPLPILGLVLLIVGYIGVFFGRLIQAAVSRQREFLADASSVQVTPTPRNCRICFLATASANRSSACSKPIRRSRNASAFSTRISTVNFRMFTTTGATNRLKKYPNPNGSRCRISLARWSAAQSSHREMSQNHRSSVHIPSCRISVIPRRCISNTPSNCATRCPTA
jgi:Zn-dependent protease with chaperone function